MGTRILSEDAGAGQAIFYDSVTMKAFGPVMDNAQLAEAFLEWLGSDDPRRMDMAGLSDKWSEFSSTHKACAGCDDITSNPDHVCDECRSYSKESARIGNSTVGSIGRRLLSAADEWTADRVKDELPAVRVRIDRDVVDADVSGRKTPFAKLHFTLRGVPSSAEVAWEALVRSLNSGIPVAV